MPEQNDELELERDDQFHRREWQVQRFGWGLWAILITAALAGLLGPGPLSDATATSASGMVTVAYDRFLHYHDPTTLRVTIDPTAITGQRLQVKVSQQFLARVQIHRIHPEPTRSELADDGSIFVFERAAGSEQPVQIVFHVEHQAYGTTKGGVELVGHEAVEFQQFSFP